MEDRANENKAPSSNQQLSYAIAGRENAPGLILIHGWMSHRNVWAQTIEVLKLSHRCLAVDLLGFGDSPKPAHTDYSIPAQTRRVLQLADSLGFQHFDLLGHSMGAQIALYLAARIAPERVNKVVSVAGVVSGRMAPGVERTILPLVSLGARSPFLYDLARRLSRFRVFATLLFYPWFYQMNSLPFDRWEIDRRMACQRALHMSAYKASRGMRALNLSADLAYIRAPVLAVHGKQDRTVAICESELIQKHAANRVLGMIERCGHFPMYEQRDKYLDYLLAFLGQDNDRR